MVALSGGEFVVGYEDGDTVYRPGEVYELIAGTLHVERTGHAGAVILAGRK